MNKMMRIMLAGLLLCSMLLCSCEINKPPQLEDESIEQPEYPELENVEVVDRAYAYHNVFQDSTSGVIEGIRKSITTLIYDHEYFTFDGRGIFKYDLLTGELMAACTDPGCTHHSEGCISYSLPERDNEFCTVILQFIDDGKLYFSVGGKLYTYDFEKSNLELFVDLSLNDVAINAYSSGNYVYLTRRLFDEEEEEYHNSIARADKKTKEVETIAEFGASQTVLSYIWNGRMYFQENDFTVYSTDMDCQDRKELLNEEWLWQFCLSGDKLIYSAITEFTPTHYMHHITIYSLDLTTGEKKTICEDPVFKYCVTDNYIYYMCRLAEGDERYDLWRVGHDGGGKTKVLTFKTEAEKTGFESIFVDGDYFLGYNVFDGADYCYDLTDGSFTMLGSKIWYR